MFGRFRTTGEKGSRAGAAKPRRNRSPRLRVAAVIAALTASTCVAVIDTKEIANYVSKLARDSGEYRAEARDLEPGQCDRALELVALSSRDMREARALLEQARAAQQLAQNAVDALAAPLNRAREARKLASENLRDIEDRPNLQLPNGRKSTRTLAKILTDECECEGADRLAAAEAAGLIEYVDTATCDDTGFVSLAGGFKPTCASIMVMYDGWKEKRENAKRALEAADEALAPVRAAYRDAWNKLQERIKDMDDIRSDIERMSRNSSEVHENALRAGCTAEQIDQAQRELPGRPFATTFDQDVFGSGAGAPAPAGGPPPADPGGCKDPGGGCGP